MRGITAVKPGDCFDHWHQVTCREFSVTECRRVTSLDFNACVEIRGFGALELCDIWSTTPPDNLIQVTRGPAEIREDPRDHFMLWLMLSGEARLAQDGREACMQAGDLSIQDQSKPFALELGQQSHAVMILVPRPLLTARVPAIGRLAARRIASDSKLGALAGTIVRELFQLENDMVDEVAQRLGASTLDILATTLEAEFDLAGGDAKRHRHLEEVKRYILANLHDPELELKTIVGAQNVSARTLYRLFVEDGTTPMRWLWQQRLAASFKALAEGQVTQVTDAALNYGFSDLSHFSRAFKAAYGISPRDLMRRKNLPS